MRTTLDIDEPILRDLMRLKEIEGKSLGRLVSDLLAGALKEKARSAATPTSPVWISKPMLARIDLSDQEAIHRALDR